MSSELPHRCELRTSQFPTFSIFAVNVLGRFGRVLRPHFWAVPLEPPADTDAHRDAAEQNDFRQISRDIEVAVSRWAAANRIEPLLLLHLIVVGRSEEHTSELQSRSDLVCRLLLVPRPPPSPLFPYTTLFRSARPSPAFLGRPTRASCRHRRASRRSRAE